MNNIKELNKKELGKLKSKYSTKALYNAIVDGQETIIQIREIYSTTFKIEYYTKENNKYVMDESKPVWSRNYHKDVKIKNKICYI